MALTIALPAFAAALPRCNTPVPPDMGLVALVDGGWSVHLSDAARGQWAPVTTDQEVRTFAFSPGRGQLLYAAADGSIRHHTLGTDEEREFADGTRNLHQPRFAPTGEAFYAVQFVDGASADTGIVRVEPSSSETRPPTAVVTQPGAVFSPMPSPDGRSLLYTVAHCTEGCGRIIQEVWRKSLVSGRADQLTLLGAMSADPVSDGKGGPIHFAIQDRDGEAIITFEPARGEIVRRYRIGTRNRHPVLDAGGRLYFLTDLDERLVVARFASTGDTGCYFPLPGGVADARELVAGV